MHSLSEVEAYWDDSANEDLAGSEEAKNILWELKKKKKVLVDFCFPLHFFGYHLCRLGTRSKTKARVNAQVNSAGRAAAATEQRCVCFLICNVNASAQQFA